MISPDVAFAIAGAIAVFCVGMGKGGVPMMGMLSVPILALVMSPVAAAGLLLPIYVISDMLGVWAYRREYSARNIAILVPASAIGIAIGWAVASIVTDSIVQLTVGLVGLGFCLMRWFGGRDREARPADIPRGLFWGAASGLTSFLTHAGAPPYQMYVVPQKLPKMVYAGTTTIIFASVNVMKLLPYWELGQLNPGNLQVTALLLPIAIIGTFVGVKLTRTLPEKLFYRLVMTMLFLLSLKLTYDGLSALVSGAA